MASPRISRLFFLFLDRRLCLQSSLERSTKNVAELHLTISMAFKSLKNHDSYIPATGSTIRRSHLKTTHPTLHIAPPHSSTLNNQVFLTFLDMCHTVLLPLMYSTSIPLGGLGLDPFHIGALGIFGCVNSLIQMKYMPFYLKIWRETGIYICNFRLFRHVSHHECLCTTCGGL